jgi:peptidyl-prolyl cis-trans isomerase A (cyclophilin A)
MSRQPISRNTFALLAALALLAAPAFAGHHEAGETQPSAKAETPADAFKRLIDTNNETETAPAQFKVEFDTTQGKIVLEVHRDWSPNGADRFYNLVKLGYYEDIAFFRVIEGFMAQFGMHGNPRINKAWSRKSIADDPVKESNKRGYVTFAKRNQPNTRTTQIFINLVDNTNLDGMGFAPFGRVVEGMDVVDSIYVTGEAAPGGKGPKQQRITISGNSFLKKKFPQIDYVKSARIVE